jgi:hypothetical protein
MGRWAVSTRIQEFCHEAESVPTDDYDAARFIRVCPPAAPGYGTSSRSAGAKFVVNPSGCQAVQATLSDHVAVQ